MGNRRLPIGRHQPRSQKAGHHPKGITRPISERNLTFAYELETWWLAGCRHDQLQALLRWSDLKGISVPLDCLFAVVTAALNMERARFGRGAACADWWRGRAAQSRLDYRPPS